ncbi:hypothetical protein H310_04830 [Aphanomyces invadans]|uniref:Uncharacterized protein n=1 Tax=Aphanomyces invadans TaxID=157072 RepID=A0A024UAA9_9STRA|nr:hypothetical protein H310_04830 [Aphanomyces invadans]ETW03336.1 hypothetical protein H310_04830 [Aphanomyces invadans]|eukprot:XP_008867565.1 hypothetical protein H310_04830 [Aphanomyces invadans]
MGSSGALLPGSRWHWQTREAVGQEYVAVKDLAKRHVVPLHELLCKRTFDAWQRSKRVPTSQPSVVQENGDDDVAKSERDERVQAWLDSKRRQKHQSNRVEVARKRPEVPPFKPRVGFPVEQQVRRTKDKAPPKRVAPCARDPTKASEAYNKWLRQKASERKVIAQLVKQEAEDRETARRELHAKAWVRQDVVMLAYACPVARRRR